MKVKINAPVNSSKCIRFQKVDDNLITEDNIVQANQVVNFRQSHSNTEGFVELVTKANVVSCKMVTSKFISDLPENVTLAQDVLEVAEFDGANTDNLTNEQLYTGINLMLNSAI